MKDHVANPIFKEKRKLEMTLEENFPSAYFSKYSMVTFNENIQNKLVPIYETIPGWKTSTYGLTNWNDLPKKAKDYISFLESKIEKNISIISTGPDRIHTIDRNNLLSNN